MGVVLLQGRKEENFLNTVPGVQRETFKTVLMFQTGLWEACVGF